MVSYFQNILLSFRLADLVDIFVLSILVYFVLMSIKGTRVVYMLTLLSIGVVGLWVSAIKGFELYAVHRVLTVIIQNAPLIVIVLFQSEIRRALMQVGTRKWFLRGNLDPMTDVVDEIVMSCVMLSGNRVGGLIVIERRATLTDYFETGVVVDSIVSKELITSIFSPESPIHDGAIVIQGNRIRKAGCFLPISMEGGSDSSFGARHRAALGLSQEIDAIVVVVSEAKGDISIVMDGQMSSELNIKELRDVLTEQFKSLKTMSAKVGRRREVSL